MTEEHNAFDIPKSEWAPGPWHEEPDRVEWRHAGLPCLMVRGPQGAWCGYVGVTPEHPWHGQDPFESCEDVEVHGGLNYGKKCLGLICHVPEPGESDDVWWLGFDCGHAGDVCPLSDIRDARRGLLPGWPGYTYKAVAYVRAEVERLADQVLAARVTSVEGEG